MGRKIKPGVGREVRSSSLAIKLSSGEKQAVAEAAAEDGKLPSEWARQVLLREAMHQGEKQDLCEAILNEVISVRKILSEMAGRTNT